MTNTTKAPDGAVIKTSIESVQGAIANFDKIAAGLAELQAAHPLDVICEVGTPAGMRQAIAARAAWRDPRIAVEKARKEAKAPVLALGKQIDAFAAGLETQLRLGEDHYDAQIKAEEERKEKAKQERAAAEAKRIAAHQERIASDIVMATRGALGESAARIAVVIADVEAIPADEATFEEFAPQAEAAKLKTLATLRELHAEAVAREAEEARIASERAEQAERDRVERERVAAEQAAESKRLAEERAELERQREAARAEQARIDAEAAALRKAADEKAAAERADADRVARVAREAEEARLKAERDELKRQQDAAEAERIARETKEADEANERRIAAEAEQRRKDDQAAEERRLKEEAEAAARALANAARERLHGASQQMLDALEQWRCAEMASDDDGLAKARMSRDAAIEAATGRVVAEALF